MPDLIIRNARVYDGTGGAPYTADVVVDGKRITSIGEPIQPGPAAEDVDASGLAVMPGIVDLHTHSDVSLVSDPGCVSAIGQGITTQLVGLCGFSAAPVSEASRTSIVADEPIFAFPDVRWSWSAIDGYREAVDRLAPATNVATLVGHNTLRRFVMGSANAPPTVAELDRMRALLREGLRQGARGFPPAFHTPPACLQTRRSWLH